MVSERKFIDQIRDRGITFSSVGVPSEFLGEFITNHAGFC